MNSKKTILKVKDHSVSGEEFQLVYNQSLEMLETFPQPEEDKLPVYYKSDDYISHTDSKRNLFEKVYHLVRNIALKRKLKLINSVSTETKNLLDIGCGTGDFLQVAQNNNWNVTGIEPNEKARALANTKISNQVLNASELINLKKNSFDIITLWHVLEHLPNIEDQISVLKKLLKHNGTIIIAVPNHKSFDASYYKTFWAAYDVPRHLWHFSKTAIKKLFKKEQMDLIKILPMKFDAYYVSLLSEKYKTGKMNFMKAFWIGWQSNLKAKKSGEYSSLIYIIKNEEN